MSVPQILTTSRTLVQPALRKAVDRLDPSMRDIVGYHLGWCDPDGSPLDASHGKSVRSALAVLSARAVGAGPDLAIPGAVAVELVHNFSLVHDDVMDRDTERRHRPTVWAVWNDATAILVGDMMLSLAHEVIIDSGSVRAAEAARVITGATAELIRGQMQDLAFESRSDVGLDECLDMAVGKTASLLSASATIGGVLAGGDTQVLSALRAYGHHVGIAFQIVDDVLGIWGDPQVTGKPVHSDLRARKKSLPITWTIENAGTQGSVLSCWLAESGESDDHELARIAGLIEDGGGRAWADEEAHRRLGLALEAVETAHLPDDCRDDLVELATYLTTRKA